MPRRVAVVIVAEDCAHQCFGTAFWNRIKPAHLRLLDFKKAGGGNNLDKVFAEQLQWARASGATCSIIVLTDADVGTPESVRKRLEEFLSKSNISPITAKDMVLIVAAKRRIENWVRFLTTGDADESNPAPRYKDYIDIREAARKLADACQSSQRVEGFPPSLEDACSMWSAYKSLMRG